MEHSIRKEQECRLFETWKQTSMYSEETYANFLDKVGFTKGNKPEKTIDELDKEISGTIDNIINAFGNGMEDVTKLNF